MKTISEIKSTALFYIDGKAYSGLLEVNQGKKIIGKILVEKPFEKPNMLEQYIFDVVHVIIRESNIIATLFNCIIYNSYISSHGLYEYTINSNYMITGDFFNNKEAIKIKKLSFINNDFSQIIGNSLVKTTIYTKENRTNIEINNEVIENECELNEYKTYRAIVPYMAKKQYWFQYSSE